MELTFSNKIYGSCSSSWKYVKIVLVNDTNRHEPLRDNSPERVLKSFWRYELLKTFHDAALVGPLIAPCMRTKIACALQVGYKHAINESSFSINFRTSMRHDTFARIVALVNNLE